MKVLVRILKVLVGLILIGIGITALVCPAETFVTLSWLWAALLLAGGVALIVAFFVAGSGAPGRGFLLFAGIVQLILGIMLISNGVLFTTMVALTMLQIWIIFSGIESIISCIEEKRAGISTWWLTMILGILCLLIGTSTFTSAIFTSTLLVVTVGAGLIISGVIFIVRGVSKNPADKAEQK